MQKIFIKYITIIMTVFILIMLVINTIFQMRAGIASQYNTFSVKIDQIISTMKINEEELVSIEEHLDEVYLTRANIAAYVFELYEENDGTDIVEYLQYLTELLEVDELHIIDENGILIYSSVPEYIGLNFRENEQTVEFMSIVDGNDGYVIQEMRPNAAEGKMMKYVGVARIGQKGIVQIGIEPVRLIEAQEKNTYEYLFSIFPTDEAENFFAISATTGEILGHTNSGSETDEDVHQLNKMEDCENGSFKQMENGELKYIVTRRYGDVIIGAALSAETLYSEIFKNMLMIFCYLILMEIIIIVLLSRLVKRNVVDGIQRILRDLSGIEDGNMDIIVAEKGSKELEELSLGINTMVRSIANNSDRIAKIINLSGMPLAAFEYQKGIECVFVTANTCELLGFDEEEIRMLCRTAQAFYQRINDIMQKPVEGETDIYQLGEEKYVRILMLSEPEGYLGIVTDMSKEILEKRQIRYDNNHDRLTGLRTYSYFKQMATDILY